MSASTQPPRIYNGRPVITTTEASAKSGFTRDYIVYLLDTGRIEGAKPWGREWMVYADSLDAFLAQPRSKGRKGPRKKRIEQGGRVLLSTAEAQDLTGYARDTLLRLLRSGRITGEKSGRSWMIYEDSLLEYRRRKHPALVESAPGESEQPPSLPSPPESSPQE